MADPRPDATVDLAPPDPQATVVPDAPAAGPQPAAQRIAGYEVLAEIGRGAMGVVYKARHSTLGRVVALKMILSGSQAGSLERMRFQIEAEAVARLRHPNVVQLYEVGEHDGQPFFSLEFCDGGTLAQRLDGGGLPAREAAGVVEQLARGMDAAHRAGVIHRDLKPANVLLSLQIEDCRLQNGREDGAARSAILNLQSAIPKITDFGLARHLDNEDSRATRAGAIMGTPSYMPPEQAAGESVGPAADVYALGAILYDVLTGRPPFQGTTIFETLTQVRSQEPVPPSRLLNGNLPRDLETICLKCLRKDPAKRYASAGDLADDLRSYLDGRPIGARRTPPWERAWLWARRDPARAALTGVGALLLLTVLVGGPLVAWRESRRAQREAGLRGRAEANFRAAQDAVDTMLTRIAEERLEFEPRLEGLRQDVLERAVGFYEKFLKEAGDDPATRTQAARALARVGLLRRQLGQTVFAEEAYRRALTLIDDDPAERARVLMDLATLRDDPEMYREAIKGLFGNGDFLAAGTASTGMAVSLARAGKRDEAESRIHSALQLLKEAGGPAALREDARAWGTLGQLRREAGDLRNAEPYLETARDRWTALVAGKASLPGDRHELALSHDRLGDLHRATKPAEAVKPYREAMAVAAALVADYPNFPDFRKLLAQVKNNLGLALLAAGSADAEKELSESVSIKRRLADAFPKRAEYRRDLASALVNHAVLLQSRGKPAEAAFGQAAELYAALGERHEAALARTNQGAALQAQGRPADAEKAYRAALAEPGTLPAERFEAARTRFLLATLLQMTGKLDEAEALHRAALALYKGVPPEPDHVLALCGALNNLADLLRATRRPAEALALWGEARAKLQALAKADPRPLYAQEEARALHNLGATHTQTGKLKEGQEAHEAALAIRARLAKDHPREPAYRQELASSHGELGITHGTANRVERSVEAFRRAIEVVAALQKEHPGQPPLMADEVDYQTNLAAMLKATGDEAGAKACGDRVAALKAKLGGMK